MKNSGEKWIGSIPDNWEVTRGRNILNLLARPVLDTDSVITCFRDGEVTLRSNRREEGFTFSLQEVGYQGIEVGDLVVHGMDGFAGAIGISDSRGKATPVLNVLDSAQDKKYLMYYLRCAAYCGLFLSLSTGIRVRSCDTNWNKLKNIIYLVPSLNEQRRIADFLDRRCAEIDGVIEATKKTIEEYKTLKQSIITEAVTKGVRGVRPMKDSGSSYIGAVPDDWSVVISRFVVDQIADVDHYMPESTESGIPYVMTGDLEKSISEIDFDNCKKISENDYLALRKKVDIEIGDVIFARYATIGTVCYVDVYKECVISYSCVTIKPSQDKLWGRFLFYYLQSTAFFEEVKQFINSNTQGNVGIEALYRVKIPVPSFKEQGEIANYLNKKCLEMERMIVTKQQLIIELETYKKSVIYEYVTGKREVLE